MGLEPTLSESEPEVITTYTTRPYVKEGNTRNIYTYCLSWHKLKNDEVTTHKNAKMGNFVAREKNWWWTRGEFRSYSRTSSSW